MIRLIGIIALMVFSMLLVAVIVRPLMNHKSACDIVSRSDASVSDFAHPV